MTFDPFRILVTPDEAAAALAVSPSQFDRLAARDGIPFVAVGTDGTGERTHKRYRLADLERWAAERVKVKGAA